MNKQSFMWLTISSKIFVDFLGDAKLLLYDTSTGNFMYSCDKKLYDIVSRLYLPGNLGVIPYETSFAQIIKEAISKRFLSVCERQNATKPINLLPILSLQKDLKHDLPGQITGDKYALLGNKLYYLSGIYVSLDCGVTEDEKLACYRNMASRQYPCIRYSKEYSCLSEFMLSSLLEQIKSSSVAVVDFVCSYRFYKEYSVQSLVTLLEGYPYKYRMHIYAEDYVSLCEQDRLTLSEVCQLFVYMDAFTPQTIKEFMNNQTITCRRYHLLYSSSEQELSGHFECLPVWTNENEMMFKENVWTSLEDLQQDSRNMSYLFRNQKLNSNFFGILDVSYLGEIYPHGSFHRLGNIANKYAIVEAISSELRENHSWRRTRNHLSHCQSCPFRYVCPPVAISELMRPDIKMCNINSDKNEK